MRRVKIFVIASVMAGLVMLLVWPWVVGSRPPRNAPRKELAGYGMKLSVYLGLSCLPWLMAAGGCILWIRQTRREFVDREKDNMRELIEGTLRDHERRTR